MGARVLVAAVVVAAVVPAHAQRREGERRSAAVLEVTLPVSVKFGGVTVKARTYRVSLAAGGLALADPRTMVLMATVPAEEGAAEWLEDPRIELERKGDKITLSMRAGDRVYRANGVVVAGESPRSKSPVVLAGKTERAVGGGSPEERTETQLVARAIKRYVGGIKHCADKAHRSRWGTDDRRFVNCVCPIVLRWKMPPLEAPLSMHWPLVKGRHGFSFHVNKAGKVTSCRVWAGAEPPAEKKPEKPAETSPEEKKPVEQPDAPAPEAAP